MLFHLVQNRIDVIKSKCLLPSQAFEEREESSTKTRGLAVIEINKLTHHRWDNSKILINSRDSIEKKKLFLFCNCKSVELHL